jgi:hypothetical protein
MKKRMLWLHLNVAAILGEYQLMYTFPTRRCGTALKLASITIIELVDWRKAKWQTVPEGVHADFLRHDFACAWKWHWNLSNVNVIISESVVNM